jgi:hypothetical protein
MTNEDVLAKVAKLLALSTSPNEHEAAAAMEKAHSLLADHNLSMSQVKLPGTESADPVGHATAESKIGAPWIRAIWQSTAKLYFCDYAYSKGRNHNTNHWVIGTAANSATACQMAHYFTETVIRLSNEAAKTHDDTFDVSKGVFIANFRKGCSNRLAIRMRDKRMEAEETPVTSDGSNLPAIYKDTAAQNQDYMKNELGTKEGKSRAVSVTHNAGYRAGSNAGNSVGLDTQIGGTA